MKKLFYATMTQCQRRVFDVITRYFEEHGCCPSYEEIGHLAGLRSLATIHKHLVGLERRRFIKRDYNRSRSIEITAKGKRAVHTNVTRVPLLDPTKSLAENYDLLWERYAQTREVGA